MAAYLKGDLMRPQGAVGWYHKTKRLRIGCTHLTDGARTEHWVRWYHSDTGHRCYHFNGPTCDADAIDSKDLDLTTLAPEFKGATKKDWYKHSGPIFQYYIKQLGGPLEKTEEQQKRSDRRKGPHNKKNKKRKLNNGSALVVEPVEEPSTNMSIDEAMNIFYDNTKPVIPRTIYARAAETYRKLQCLSSAPPITILQNARKRTVEMGDMLVNNVWNDFELVEWSMGTPSGKVETFAAEETSEFGSVEEIVEHAARLMMGTVTAIDDWLDVFHPGLTS